MNPWTPENITLARRVIACGLPVPMGRVIGAHGDPVLTDVRPGNVGVRLGESFRCHNGIMWSFFREPDNGPVLLPVLDDFALLGWVITDARRRLDEPHLRARWSKTHQCWEIYGDGSGWRNIAGHHAITGLTEVEAWTAALESAKAAR